MLAGTLSQVSEFVFSLALGVLLGLLYELFGLSRRALRGGIVVTVIADVLFVAAALAVYTAASYAVLGLKLRWYLVAGNVAGFVMERNSLGRLLAKFFDMVYNYFHKQFEKRKGTKRDGEEN